MATLTAHTALNVSAITDLNEANATVLAQSSTSWSVTDGVLTDNLQGSGLVFADGDVDGGTVTQWARLTGTTPHFTLSNVNYILSGPGSPQAIVGHDIWDYGYLGDYGYPVYGTQADIAWMLRGDDQVIGSSGNDYLGGYEGNDQISGNGGNDILRGWMGDDTIDGGTGVDTAAYLSFRSDVAVLKTSATSWTTINGGGYDGTDTLSNIERLVFLGGEAHALDVAGDGAAGTVVKLIGAIFGAEEVSNTTYVGIGLQFADQGMTPAALAAFALNAIGQISNTQVVETLWHHVIGGTIDQGSRDYYVNMLSSGSTTKGELAVMAANTSFNLENINYAGIAEVGIDYTLQGTVPF